MTTLAAVASTAVIAADFDPTVQPTRGSFWVFAFMAVSLVLLIVSMLRHLRRARENLAPTRPQFEGFEEARPERPTPDQAGSDRA